MNGWLFRFDIKETHYSGTGSLISGMLIIYEAMYREMVDNERREKFVALDTRAVIIR